MRRILAYTTKIAALLFVLMSIVYVRVLYSSRIELREAEAASDHDGRIDHLGRAARLYAPINPFSERAIDRLRSDCSDFKLGGPLLAPRPREEDERHLAACRELRSAILATRSFYTPHSEILTVADEIIASLAARLESPSVDPGAGEAARRKWHAERLAESEAMAPRIGWTLLALFGFALWIGSAILFIFRGLDAEDRLVPRPALASFLGIACGFVLFLVGLSRA